MTERELERILQTEADEAVVNAAIDEYLREKAAEAASRGR